MIYVEQKTRVKRKMLDACIARQQTLITDLKNHIKSLFENENLAKGNLQDSLSTPVDPQIFEEANLLNNALNFANKELQQLHQLYSIEDLLHNKVELGAAVVTHLGTFFISADLEEVQMDGEFFMGLSSDSPFYLAMKGKRIGEMFIYKGTSYHIQDIF
ncbi:hypothetical protein QWY93_14500 [Echinicola jeungdonensis]|uniref:Transcription elongation factor n=1 Tax=Echinicola jeungdonensis TaxID=709343 RepID=A0ABV5JA59_9BACT|nr:hypothetical protein [Echinicola jeungdonensis]MDN3670530.1 hypothetical protein [Echinicola jeungdonensis]